MATPQYTNLRHRSDHGVALAAGIIAVLLILPLWVMTHQNIPRAAAAGSFKGKTAVTAPAAPGLVALHDHYSFAYKAPQQAPPFPAITAASGILIDTDNKQILWQQNPHTSLAPASTAKIVTALVALENFREDRKVTVTANALNQAGDETKLGLHAGDTLSVHDLIYAMLMISANDAATALADDTVGMPAFVRGMNAQVAALGLKDSHFVAPVGLDDPGEKASAYDLAVLGLAAYDNFSLFRSVVGTQQYDIPAATANPDFSLSNINLLLTMYPGVQGIKPGYTGDAGYCLVAMATRNGHRLVSVLMNAAPVYHQSAELLDWGFQALGVPSALPKT